MSNLETERLARAAVIQYEANRGRTEVEGEGGKGSGYDLKTQNAQGESRLIEIKSTKKPYLTARWLEPLEFEVMMTNDNYWVYAVLNAVDSPRIRAFSKTEWLEHFDREELKRWYKFSRKEFAGAEEP